ncbi:MAG: DNA recombination protein RmuC [Bacteroidota bacterium]
MLEPLSFSLGAIFGLLTGGIAVFIGYQQVLKANREQLEQKNGELTAARQGLQERQQAMAEYKSAAQQAHERIIQLTHDLSHAQTEQQALKREAENRQRETAELQAKFQLQFENLAHKIFEQNTQSLSKKNSTELNHLLQPLKERLQSFEKRVDDAYQQEARERFHLQKEIEQLTKLNLQMSEDAQRLARALKGDSKKQGNWGEMVLTRVLESSGLREGEEFVLQGKGMNLRQEGKLQQPDVVVKLPEGKHLIIDAKVSLKAYEEYTHSEDEKTGALLLKAHLDSVWNHVRDLSDKHYQANERLNAPDFVLMFMPVEGAFSLAMQARPELFANAWERRIVVVSPTTLLATLRTVASIWKMERQNENAQEIARQGGLLYDKFVSFVEDLNRIGKSLEKAESTYQDVVRKLSVGPGNLTSRAEKLRELGVKAKKRLP